MDDHRRSITAALDALAERRAEIGTDGDGYVWHGGEVSDDSKAEAWYCRHCETF
jgi:hypothetical protein